MPKDNTKSLFGLYARDLQQVLEYGSWDKFKRVIQKAMAACEQSGKIANDHFVQVGKKVSLGSGAMREIEDIEHIMRLAAKSAK